MATITYFPVASGGGGGGVSTATAPLVISGSNISIYPGSWASTQLTRIKTLAPSAGIDSVWMTDLLYNVGNNAGNIAIEASVQVSGSGSSTFGSYQPGVVTLATGATANSKAAVSSSNNNGVLLAQNPTAGPWAIVGRATITGAQDVNSTHTPIGFADSSGAFGDVLFMNSWNTGFALVMKSSSSGLNQTVTTSVAADLVNAHDYMILFDGTTIGMYIDGVVVSGGTTTSLTGMPSIPVVLEAVVRNGATTTSRTMLQDKIAFFFPSLA